MEGWRASSGIADMSLQLMTYLCIEASALCYGWTEDKMDQMDQIWYLMEPQDLEYLNARGVLV